MKPVINNTEFGFIIIDNIRYDKDVIIGLSGEVRKRNKKLSKEVYGTSHKISKEEAKDIYEEGTELIIMGAGQNSMVKLSDKAVNYFEKHQVEVKLVSTPEAMKL